MFLHLASWTAATRASLSSHHIRPVYGVLNCRVKSALNVNHTVDDVRAVITRSKYGVLLSGTVVQYKLCNMLL